MGIEKHDAIVMRSYPLRDTSRIVHMLTAARGLLKVVAKGARGPRSRFGAALEPFTRIQAVLYYKVSRDLQLLSQADIVIPRRVLGQSVLRYAYASAVCELLEQLLAGEEQSPELFVFVDETLARLEELAEDRLRAAFAGYVVRLVAMQGYRPELGRCVTCKAALAGGAAFDAQRGGIVCRRCAPGALSVHPLSADGRRMLEELLAGRLPPAMPKSVGDEIARAMDAFLRVHVPRYRRLRSLDLVRAAAGGG